MGVVDGGLAMSSVARPRLLRGRWLRRLCDEYNCRASPTLHGRWLRRRCDEFSWRASPSLRGHSEVKRRTCPTQHVSQPKCTPAIGRAGSSYGPSTGLGSRPLPTFFLESCSGTSRIDLPIRNSRRQTVWRFVAASHRAATCNLREHIFGKLN